MSRTVTVILMYQLHKPEDRIDMLGSQQRHNVFPVRYEDYPSCVYIKDRTFENVHNCDSDSAIASSQSYRT
jgi:hypothetical protein